MPLINDYVGFISIQHNRKTMSVTSIIWCHINDIWLLGPKLSWHPEKPQWSKHYLLIMWQIMQFILTLMTWKRDVWLCAYMLEKVMKNNINLFWAMPLCYIFPLEFAMCVTNVLFFFIVVVLCELWTMNHKYVSICLKIA